MARHAPLLLLVGLVLAGCGGGGTHPSTTTVKAKPCPGRTRAVAKLNADLAALRKAGTVPAKDTLLGGAAANQATDRFLLDLAKAPISNLRRNRLIDHAAADIVGSCQQCFQALEAERPIPAIAKGEEGPCAKP